jgi:hypothetical protein
MANLAHAFLLLTPALRVNACIYNIIVKTTSN